MREGILLMLIFSFISCSRSVDSRASVADIEASKAAAREEAEKVLDTEPGSMNRDRMILSIRAHETEIRKAGFDECADSFAAEAKRVLLPVLTAEKAVLE